MVEFKAIIQLGEGIGGMVESFLIDAMYLNVLRKYPRYVSSDISKTCKELKFHTLSVFFTHILTLHKVSEKKYNSLNKRRKKKLIRSIDNRDIAILHKRLNSEFAPT